MTVDPQDIAKRLRENRETTKKESTALTEQLAIIDAIIDEYDAVSYTHLTLPTNSSV